MIASILDDDMLCGFIKYKLFSNRLKGENWELFNLANTAAINIAASGNNVFTENVPQQRHCLPFCMRRVSIMLKPHSKS